MADEGGTDNLPAVNAAAAVAEGAAAAAVAAADAAATAAIVESAAQDTSPDTGAPPATLDDVFVATELAAAADAAVAESAEDAIEDVRDEIEAHLDRRDEVTAQAIGEVADAMVELEARVAAEFAALKEEVLRNREVPQETLTVTEPPPTPEVPMERKGFLARMFLMPR